MSSTGRHEIDTAFSFYDEKTNYRERIFTFVSTYVKTSECRLYFVTFRFETDNIDCFYTRVNVNENIRTRRIQCYAQFGDSTDSKYYAQSNNASKSSVPGVRLVFHFGFERRKTPGVRPRVFCPENRITTSMA